MGTDEVVYLPIKLAQALQDALFSHPGAGPVPVPASLLTLVMEELRTPRSESAAIPAGWKLVPVEPTQPMLVASWNASGVGRSPDEDREVWSAMLNAAPEAPR